MFIRGQLIRLFHTVRHLKPVQVYRRIWRPRPRTRLAMVPERRRVAGQWTTSVARESARTGPFRFRFLSEERELRGWNDAGVPKLWLYNLHYFEAPDGELIQRWIEENPPGIGNGWEPYPLSLRVVNWIKWELAGNTLTAEALASLAMQAEYLSHTVEYRLLANHLFENAKALVFAGLFFKADTWLRMGLAILRKQVPEQVLSDGGHFERSPMYHSLILEDVLDLINLGRAYPGLLPDFGGVAGRMLGWLQQMTHPDGEIAFFNDAAFGIAPTPAELIDYAGRLGIQPDRRPLAECGYIRLENECAVVLFDAAPIGPDYQPGHAHADTLSFEHSIRGHRALVNSGTSTYESGALRTWQRSTAAHNAAGVDSLDSSEVWSAFRVARRARPVEVERGDSFAAAAHSGYRRLPGRVTHRRRLDLDSGALTVADTFEGRGDHEVRLFFHLHPNADTAIHLDPKLSRTIEHTHWYPAFNTGIPNRTIVGSWRGRCPVSFITRIALH